MWVWCMLFAFGVRSTATNPYNYLQYLGTWAWFNRGCGWGCGCGRVHIFVHIRTPELSVCVYLTVPFRLILVGCLSLCTFSCACMCMRIYGFQLEDQGWVRSGWRGMYVYIYIYVYAYSYVHVHTYTYAVVPYALILKQR